MVIVGDTDTRLVLSCRLTKAAWGDIKQANSPSLSCTAIQPFVPSTLIDIGTTVANGQVRECERCT